MRVHCLAQYDEAGVVLGEAGKELGDVLDGGEASSISYQAPYGGYGKRQGEALGVDRIEWARGDILALAGFERRFDMIDCGGVLHHMREPMGGWRILRNLLKPGGVMKIGLYSELARAEFVGLGAELAAVATAEENLADRIRSYRHEIIALPDDAPLKRVLALHDFYTLSECRDLLFHIKEHHFNLPEIARCLDALDLEFIGFEMQTY